MMHLLCLVVLLVAVVFLDLRAHRRTAAILTAIRAAAQHELDDAAEEEDQGEGGALAVIEFEGAEPGDAPIVVPVPLDAGELARVDEVHEAVLEAGDRPSGERAAYLPPEGDDDDPDGGAA